MAFESDHARRVESYAFKASLLSLSSLKLPTIPLRSEVNYQHLYIAKKFTQNDFQTNGTHV